jgi:hypothetical protein
MMDDEPFYLELVKVVTLDIIIKGKKKHLIETATKSKIVDRDKSDTLTHIYDRSLSWLCTLIKCGGVKLVLRVKGKHYHVTGIGPLFFDSFFFLI